MRSCRYGAECHTAGCPFQHPSAARGIAGKMIGTPRMPEAASSDRVDARQRCHFGNDCRNPACSRSHSPEPELAAAPSMPAGAGPPGACRFGSACTNPRCTRTHPTPLAGAGAGKALGHHSLAALDRPAKHAGKAPALGTPAKPCFRGAECANAACGYGHPAGWPVRSGGGTGGSTHGCGVLQRLQRATAAARQAHEGAVAQAAEKAFKASQLAPQGNPALQRAQEQTQRALQDRVAELQAQKAAFDTAAAAAEATLVSALVQAGWEPDCLQAIPWNALPPPLREQASEGANRLRRERRRLQAALPALALRSDIEAAVRSSRFLVVQGSTGSGKSTQVPQYLAEMLGPGKRVLCTQPRKVAAVLLAERVANEWAAADTPVRVAEVGGAVGYAVGALRKGGDWSRIEYLTEGTLLTRLLAEKAAGDRRGDALRKAAGGTATDAAVGDGFQLQPPAEAPPTGAAALPRDPLAGVGAIVIDEAHERSMRCDLLLGLLKALPADRYPDLKVLVTSATLDAALFSAYLGDCPVLTIPGRTFPVDVIYLPQATAGPGAARGSVGSGISTAPEDYVRAVVRAAVRIHLETAPHSGDVLCFLTGIDEIERARTQFEQAIARIPGALPALTLALHGRQQPEEQREAFQPAPLGSRKIVFSTAIAQTSVTIDGVRHVVDAGVAKESRYDPQRNVTVLAVQPISRSTAEQRKGRAGRTSPGTCYRLYGADDFDAMPLADAAEVLSQPLELVAINLIALGVDPRTFAWVEPPDPTAVQRALRDLAYLGAINEEGGVMSTPVSGAGVHAGTVPGGFAAAATASEGRFHLTELGELMAHLQVDPSLARLVLTGCRAGIGAAAIKLAGVLSVASVFYIRPYTDREAADDSHLRLASPAGDPVTMYRAFQQWEGVLTSWMSGAGTSADTAAQAPAAGAGAPADAGTEAAARPADSAGAAAGADPDPAGDRIAALGLAERFAGGRDKLTVDGGRVEAAGSSDGTGTADAYHDLAESNDADGDCVAEADTEAGAGGSSAVTAASLGSLAAGKLAPSPEGDGGAAEAEAAATPLDYGGGAAAGSAASGREAAEAEEQTRRVTRFGASRLARDWCRDRFVSPKSLGYAQATASELFQAVQRFRGGVLWRARAQECDISDEQLQRLVVSGYFLNVAVRTPLRGSYDVLRNAAPTVCTLHPSSALVKLAQPRVPAVGPGAAAVVGAGAAIGAEAGAAIGLVVAGAAAVPLPHYVLFQSMLSTHRSQLTVLTPLDARWIKAESPLYYAALREREAAIPCKQSVICGMTEPLLTAVLGRRYCKLPQLESSLDATIQVDADARTLTLWCSPVREASVRGHLEGLIAAARRRSLAEVEEVPIGGTVRGVFGAGYACEQLLFGDEFVSVNLSGLPAAAEEGFAARLVGPFGPVRQIEVLPPAHSSTTRADAAEGHAPRSTAWGRVVFREPPHAAAAVAALNGAALPGGYTLKATASGAPPPLVPSSLRAQVTMVWSTLLPTGKARLTFADWRGANQALAALSGGTLGTTVCALGTVPGTTGVGPPLTITGQFQDPALAEGAGGATTLTPGRQPFTGRYTLGIFGLPACADEAYLDVHYKLAQEAARLRGEEAPPTPVLLTVLRKLPTAAEPARKLGRPRVAASRAGLAEINMALLESLPAGTRRLLGEQSEGSLQTQATSVAELHPNREHITSVVPFFPCAGRAGVFLAYDSPEEAAKAVRDWPDMCRGWQLDPERGKDPLTGEPRGTRLRQPIHVSARFSASFSLPQGLYAALQDDIDELAARLAARGVTIGNQPLTHAGRLAGGLAAADRRILQISGSSLAGVQAAREELSRALRFTVFMPPSRDAQAALNSPTARHGLKALAQALTQRVFMQWDARAQCLKLYGSLAARTEAGKALVPFVDSLLASQKRATFPLKRHMLHALRPRMPELFEAGGAELGPVHVVRGRLEATGSDAALEAVRAWLEDGHFLDPAGAAGAVGVGAAGGVQAAAAGAGDGGGDWDGTCSVCYDACPQPFSYRACGHGACLGCATQQFAEVPRKVGVAIPWRCAFGDGCDALVATADIAALAPIAAVHALRDVSVSKYMAEHRARVRYCPAPGCNHILGLGAVVTPGSEGEEARMGGSVALCELCERSYCLACSDRDNRPVDRHSGVRCADSATVDPAATHVRHVVDGILTLRCPKCSAAFLDWDGCMAVTCSYGGCGAGFCGFCMHLAAGGDAHPHVKACGLNPKSGTYFASAAELGAVHRHRRIQQLKEYFRDTPMPAELMNVVLDQCRVHLRDVGITRADLGL